MQSLLVLMLVFNVLAIQHGPSRPEMQHGSHEASENDDSSEDGSQGNILNFPKTTKNRHNNEQRYQDSHWKDYKALDYKEDHSDHGYDNTEEGQESSGNDTSHVDGSQGNILIFPNITEVPKVYPSRRPPLMQHFKPSLQQRPQVTATHNANGTPHSTATPSLPSPQKPVNNPSSQLESSVISQSSPASANECVCTPFFRCYDNETSSNLTNVVNDRTIIPASVCQITEKTCPNSNDVCCCNIDPPSSSTAKSLSPSQAPRPSEITKSNANCNCRPSNDCHDDAETVRTLEKGYCKEPNHVCCHDRVPPIYPSAPPLETSSVSTNPQPHQSPMPSEVSPSANAGGCTCTPFFKCYDQETSSNLTNVVNDRININQCPSSNDVCCHNLSPPSGVTETEEGVKDTSVDCDGHCVLMEYCPKLLDTFEEAQRGNSEATDKLRKLVCSRKNGLLHVCCKAPTYSIQPQITGEVQPSN